MTCVLGQPNVSSYATKHPPKLRNPYPSMNKEEITYKAFEGFKKIISVETLSVITSVDAQGLNNIKEEARTIWLAR